MTLTWLLIFLFHLKYFPVLWDQKTMASSADKISAAYSSLVYLADYLQ